MNVSGWSKAAIGAIRFAALVVAGGSALEGDTLKIYPSQHLPGFGADIVVGGPVIQAASNTVGNVTDDAVSQTADDIAQIADDIIPEDVHAFGGKTTGPRAPRVGRDIFPDELGMIGPELPLLPNGASTFADISEAPLTGHYHTLPQGTQLPNGLQIVADGSDVIAASPNAPTHHTIFPSICMHVEKFTELFQNLPWIYGGKKK